MIGLRWPADVAAERLTLRCADRWAEVVLLEPWRRLTALRYGHETTAVDVFFDAPCPDVPDGAPGDPVPLGLRGR